MFDFLFSAEKKMRHTAANWLEMAERVHDYRRDQLSEAQGMKLQTATGELKARLKDKAAPGVLQKGIEDLEAAMREAGGRIYPANSLVENVEFFLVAAIVILGMRAYFVQPFKIPTNSMWPTYYGMTAESFQPGEEPGIVRRIARLLTLGATNYTVTAPADGEVMIPITRYGQPAFTDKPGRTMWVFPAMMREYIFMVGGQQAKVTVPADFQGEFAQVLDRSFKSGSASLYGIIQAAAHAGQLESSIIRSGQGEDIRVYWVPTGKKVRQGEAIMSFDILTGDLLFVDRLTYNFFPPKIGSGFVFKTENIHSPEMLDSSGNQISQYYVKRLVGEPGNTLEIRRPVPAITDGSDAAIGSRDGQLYRNGRPIDGAAAFGKNARKEGLYPGYTADNLLGFGQVVTVPANSFFALGDNSPRSKDGRAWGFVPDKDVVGRPLFIYYPLTSRWGLAK